MVALPNFSPSSKVIEVILVTSCQYNGAYWELDTLLATETITKINVIIKIIKTTAYVKKSCNWACVVDGAIPETCVQGE